MSENNDILMYAAGIMAMLKSGSKKVSAYNDLLEDEWQGRQSALEFLYKSGDILSVLSTCCANCSSDMCAALQLEPLPISTVVDGVAGACDASKNIMHDNQSTAFVNANVHALQTALASMLDAVAQSGDVLLRTCDVELTSEELSQVHSELPSGNYSVVGIMRAQDKFDIKEYLQSVDFCFNSAETDPELVRWTGMASLHGGDVCVHTSGISHGLMLILPQVKSDNDDELMARTIDGRQETILLVDDEDMIWDVVQGMLRELGYNVLLANDGQEAVEIYTSNAGEIDLVLLDMIMPVMNARDAFPLLKKADEQVKVLLASGYVDESDVQDLLAGGAMGFMRKPYRLADLARRIRTILDKK